MGPVAQLVQAQKVMGSIPEVIIGMFCWQLGTIQPLTEMSTSNFFLGGEGGRYVGMITVLPSCADGLENW
jgi:hypothetical protein